MITQVASDIKFDGKALRSTSAVSSFPWLLRLVTLVRIAEICGDSPARWQELASSWSHQPTQLLASSLFKRLRKAAGTG
jgi:hypothetical protein